MTKPSPIPRVAILGAGPVGLEAAAYALSAGLTATVYDSAAGVAEHVNRWGFVKLFTPFGLNATPLGRQIVTREKPKFAFPDDAAVLTGREFRESYLVPLSETELIKPCLQLQSAALIIGRVGWRKTDPQDPKKAPPPFRILVRTAQGQERFDTADAVFDCTGTYARPNWAGDGGIPAAGEIAARPHAAYHLEDVLGAKKAHYAGKTVAVIGGDYAAATAVCDLATLALEHQATWTVWLNAGPKQPLPRVPNDPFKERDRLAVRTNNLACRCDGNLEYHAGAVIEEIVSSGPDKGFRIAGRVNGKPQAWDVERLIAHVGYRPDVALTQELRVAEPSGDIVTGEPGYFVLGSKALGRTGEFLLKDAPAQIRRAMAAVLGQAKLDLYAKKAA